MNLPDFLEILPVRLASGADLIVVVAVLVAIIHLASRGKGPEILQFGRRLVILALYTAYLTLIALGIYLVVSSTAAQKPTEERAVVILDAANVSDQQDEHPNPHS